MDNSYYSLRSSYKKSMGKDNAMLIKGKEVTLDEIASCYSKTRGKTVSFLSRLLVLVKKQTWLNDKRIIKTLNHEHNFQNIQSAAERVNGLRANIIDYQHQPQNRVLTTGRSKKVAIHQKNKLDKMNRRLHRVQQLLPKANSNGEMLKLDDIPFDGKKPDAQVTPGAMKRKFNANLIQAHDKVVSEERKDVVQLDNTGRKAEALVKKLVIDKTFEAVKLNHPPALVKETVVSAMNLQPILHDGIDNIVHFVKTHACSSNQGQKLLGKLSPDDVHTLDRIAILEWKIAQTTKTDELAALNAELSDLKSSVDELKKQVQADHVGKLIPAIVGKSAEPVIKHMENLTAAFLKIKDEYSFFNELPPRCQEYLIIVEIAKGQKNQANTRMPISIPVVETHIQQELQRLLRLAKRIVKDENLKFTDDNPTFNRIRDLDLVLGKELTNYDRVAERILAPEIKSLVHAVVFPNGAPIDAKRQWLIKRLGVDIDKIEDEILDQVIDGIVDVLCHPHTMNLILKPILDHRLKTHEEIQDLTAEIEKKKGFGYELAKTFGFHTKEEIHEIEQLEEKLLKLNGKNLPHSKILYQMLRSDSSPATATDYSQQAVRLKKLVFDLFKLVDTDKADMAHSIDSKLFNNAMGNAQAEQAIHGVERLIDNLCLGFDQKQFADVLEYVLGILFDKDGNFTPPESPTKATLAEMERTAIEVSGKIEALARAEAKQIINSDVLANYAADCALKIHPLFQLQSVNRILICDLLSSVASSSLEIIEQAKTQPS